MAVSNENLKPIIIVSLCIPLSPVYHRSRHIIELNLLVGISILFYVLGLGAYPLRIRIEILLEIWPEEDYYCKISLLWPQ